MTRDTLEIVALVVVDKRETGLKSTNMDTFAFHRCLDMLIRKGIYTKEIVTDQHPGITALMKMKKKYIDIKHSFDIWHVAKYLGKRPITVGNEKGNKDTLPWV